MPQGWDSCSELDDYFRTAESVAGFASSWEPLVGMAQGGIVTTRDPEARFLAGGRFTLGPSQRTLVTFHRDIRSALLRLPPGDPSPLDVLFASRGPVPWRRIVAAGLGTETAETLACHLADGLLGVALLTPEFRAGSRDWPGPTPLRASDRRASRPEWRATGAWLADLALVASPSKRNKLVPEERRVSASATLSEVGRSAATLVRCAEDAYRSVRGSHPSSAPEPKPARASRRLDGLDGLVFTAGERR